MRSQIRAMGCARLRSSACLILAIRDCVPPGRTALLVGGAAVLIAVVVGVLQLVHGLVVQLSGLLEAVLLLEFVDSLLGLGSPPPVDRPVIEALVLQRLLGLLDVG